jgi:hypothetical protein
MVLNPVGKFVPYVCKFKEYLFSFDEFMRYVPKHLRFVVYKGVNVLILKMVIDYSI